MRVKRNLVINLDNWHFQLIDNNRENNSLTLNLDNTIFICEINREQSCKTAANGYMLSGQNSRDNMAQLQMRTPLGVPVLWETGANPPTECSTWFGTLKMATMTRDNVNVDKLLKQKPTRAELNYPNHPAYEEPFEGETDDKKRQRQQQNERREVDWDNECKQTKQRRPMIDRTPWDVAYRKVKSLIYLSLGSEGSRTYHQIDPNTKIERCTTNELVHELALILPDTEIKFLIDFSALKQCNNRTNLSKTFCRLREFGSPCRFENLEEYLVKNIFISNIGSSNIQMVFLSEARIPQKALNYVINRERRQVN